MTKSKADLQTKLDEAKGKRTALAPTDPDNATPCPCCQKMIIVDKLWEGKYVLKEAPKKKGSAAQIKEANMKIAELDGEIARLAGDMMAKDSAISDANYKIRRIDRKSTRLNSSHIQKSRMPSSA